MFCKHSDSAATSLTFLYNVQPAHQAPHNAATQMQDITQNYGRTIIRMKGWVLMNGKGSVCNIFCKKVNQSRYNPRCPEGSRKLRFPDYVRTAQDGGKVVSLMHRPPLPPGNIPGTYFCYRLSQPHGHSTVRRILSTKKSNDTIRNQTHDLLACSAPTAPPHAPLALFCWTG
jgi:hypothetical protein